MTDSPAAGNPASPEAERAWDAWYEPEQDFARAIATSTHDEMHRAFLAAFVAGAEHVRLALERAEALLSERDRQRTDLLVENGQLRDRVTTLEAMTGG